MTNDSFSQRVFSEAPDALIAMTPEGRVLFWNRAAELMFGYGEPEVLGRVLMDTIIPETQHETERRLLEEARPMGAGLELFGRRKDGGEFPVEISLSPLSTEEGVLVMCAIRDASERKQFEQALREKNLELEKANQELEAFSYSVSHDLRAPLRAIDGFSKLLLAEVGDGLTEAGRGHLERVRTNAVRMGRLIDELLEFSRLSRDPLAKETVRPGELVRVCLEELHGEMEGRQIEVRTAELPEVQGDPTMLRQVWFNLLSNALKYSRNRELARIEVGVDPRNGVPEFYVRDNGVGFARNRLPIAAPPSNSPSRQAES